MTAPLLPELVDMPAMFVDNLPANRGFPYGSSLLVAGAPGTGKTVLALAVVRDLMKRRRDSQLFYVSTELNREKLSHDFRGFGWFHDQDPVFTKNRVAFPRIPELGLYHEAAGAGSMVDLVLSQTREAARKQFASAGNPNADVFVVVDSLTTVLQDSKNEGERRQHAYKFISGLQREPFADHLAQLLLLSEYPLSDCPESETPPEEYVVDIVLKLALKHTAGARRMRTLEISKSRGVKMALGEHTFTIVTSGEIEDVVAQRRTIDRVRRQMCEGAHERDPWGTVIVAPRPHLRRIGKTNDPAPDAEEQTPPTADRGRLWTGTFGLDDMLRGNQVGRAEEVMQRLDDIPRNGTAGQEAKRKQRRDRYAGLHQGSTTLILGSTGTGKTTLCLQFLLQQVQQDVLPESVETCLRLLNERKKRNLVDLLTALTPGEDNWKAVKEVLTATRKTMYVNFENPPKAVIDNFPGPANKWEAILRNCEFLYRRRSNLDVNLLFLELRNALRPDDRRTGVDTGTRIDGRSGQAAIADETAIATCGDSINPKIERVVIDGLSDLLATTDKHEYSRMVETLIETVRKASDDKATMLVTYEMPPNFVTFSPLTEGLSVAADNIVLLRQLPISDELHKTVCVLKARDQQQDRQVREIEIHRSDEHRMPLYITPGRLENYSHLLFGDPQPPEIVLHLFAENEAERRFNESLRSRLRKRFGRQVKALGFSRAEMTRTLEDAINHGGRIPASDVGVISIDEWWIREHFAILAQHGHQEPRLAFLALDRFCAKRGRVGRRDLRTEFWTFDMEKSALVLPARSLANDPVSDGGDQVNAKTLAVPIYQDFGLFCVNRDRLAQYLSKPTRRKRRAPKAEIDCPDLFRSLPFAWVGWNGRKFREPDQQAKKPVFLVDLIARARVAAIPTNEPQPRGNQRFIGFAFDMETLETAVCTYLEFCWSFGASEDFLTRDALEYQSQKEADRRQFVEQLPATVALRFLQYLVARGLMPARTSLKDCEDAFFTRQWYSTFRELTDWHEEGPATTTPGHPAGNGKHLATEPRVPLAPLPFFPVGFGSADSRQQVPEAVFHALEDATIKLQRILDRALTTVESRAGRTPKQAGHPQDRGEPHHSALKQITMWRKSVEPSRLKSMLPARDPALFVDQARKWIAELRGIGHKLRDIVVASPLFIPGALPACEEGPIEQFSQEHTEDRWWCLSAGTSMDARDALELLNWHELRLKLIESQLDQRHWVDVAYPRVSSQDEHAGRPPSAHAVSAANNARAPRAHANDHQVTGLTGYAASGAWLVGILEPSHSPNIAWSLIEEMTSLGSARDRATQGAGIPARKDFFEFYGNERLKHAEHLSWRDLLQFAGSRARRRDRTVCPMVRVSEVLGAVYNRLMQCLTAAGEVAESGSELPPTAAEDHRLQELAVDSMTDILESVFEQMRAAWLSAGASAESRVCPGASMCLYAERCQKLK
jgi:KaiC/GvpD/RAD55 family RecA-like ATPase